MAYEMIQGLRARRTESAGKKSCLVVRPLAHPSFNRPHPSFNALDEPERTIARPVSDDHPKPQRDQEYGVQEETD